MLMAASRTSLAAWAANYSFDQALNCAITQIRKRWPRPSFFVCSKPARRTCLCVFAQSTFGKDSLPSTCHPSCNTMRAVRCLQQLLSNLPLQHREPLALTIKPSRLPGVEFSDTVPAQSFCAEITQICLSCFVGWRCIFCASRRFPIFSGCLVPR